MDKFLEIYDLPRLNCEELENLNRPINIEETETPSTTSPPPKKKKVQDQIASLVNSTKHSKIILLILFQRIKEEAILPTTCYETNRTLIPKSGMDNTK